MMNDTIAEAWAGMVAKRPVGEDDLRRIAHQVADELIQAAAPERADTASVGTSQPITLGEGFSLHVSEVTFQSPRGNVFRVSLDISCSRGSNRATYIAAQCSPGGGNLGISSPDGRPEVVLWTEEDGDQRPWLFQKLRQQVADYIGS